MSTTSNRSTTQAPADRGIFHELDQRRRRSCLSCQSLGCAGLLLMILVAAGLATAIAATGVIRVPGVSQLVYATPPAPSRSVAAVPVELDELLGAPHASEGPATLTLSEGQLTSLVAADKQPAFRQSQVVVNPGEVELFGYYVALPMGDPVALTATLTVGAAGGECALKQLTVGRLTVPPMLTASLGHQLCQLLLGGLANGQIEQLTAGEGSLTVSLISKP